MTAASDTFGASSGYSFGRLLDRTRQGLLLAVAFVLLAVIASSVAWLVDQSAREAQLVAHTLRVQDLLSNVLLSSRRAESAQRGYLFTRQHQYLADFNEGRPEAEGHLSRLNELLKANPGRLAKIRRIEQIVDARFQELNRVLELVEGGDEEGARQVVLEGSGRRLTIELREAVEQAIAFEAGVLAEHVLQSQRTNRLLLIVSIVGAALVALIGALSIYLVQRNYRQAEDARRELAVTNENLERIVEYRTADLREANEEIQRFAYIVSHDLRSPLVNIMGFTSELDALRRELFDRINELRKQLDALNAQAGQPAETQAGEAAQKSPEELGREFDEALGFIKTSIGKMDRLINAVLKLSREGRREFRPERINMDALIESIARTVAHRANELGATLAVGDLPDVESDRLALEQVFSNLIDNALKYLRPNEPGRIEIAGHSNAAQVIYDVIDNGRGIDVQDHQRIFELFRRAGVQDRPGEGIGLAHVRALVRRMGGHMSLKSEPGKGSTFTVTLPRKWSVGSRSVA